MDRDIRRMGGGSPLKTIPLRHAHQEPFHFPDKQVGPRPAKRCKESLLGDHGWMSGIQDPGGEGERRGAVCL